MCATARSFAVSEIKELRTDNLSLAATLMHHGHSPERIEPLTGWHGPPRGVWVFDDADGRATKVAEEFESGKASIEPRTFTMRLSEARNSMFQWLDEQG